MTLELSSDIADDAEDIIALFAAAFAASEGDEASQTIGALVRDMLANTSPSDLEVCIARRQSAIAGCVLFSRMVFDADERTVFILSPVAVAPSAQGQGIGQALLNDGLDRLRQQHVDVVLVYGDPAYYGKVGFAPIRIDEAPPPFALSQPQGWQAQSLKDQPFSPLKGRSSCVDALQNPDLW